ncbi:MAG: TRAM domain-containing protein, partial [Evtepia sp.]
AAALDDPMPPAQKHQNFERLLQLQNNISAERHHAYLGKTLPCLVDGLATDGVGLSARTPGGRLVHLRDADPSLIGRVLPITITDASSWSLFGKEDF